MMLRLCEVREKKWRELERREWARRETTGPYIDNIAVIIRESKVDKSWIRRILGMEREYNPTVVSCESGTAGKLILDGTCEWDINTPMIHISGPCADGILSARSSSFRNGSC